MGQSKDSMSVLREFEFNGESYSYYSLQAAEESGAGAVMGLPRSLKVLLENMLRHEDGLAVTEEHLRTFCAAVRERRFDQEVFFHPTRILMNDSAGIPLWPTRQHFAQQLPAMGVTRIASIRRFPQIWSSTTRSW